MPSFNSSKVPHGLPRMSPTCTQIDESRAQGCNQLNRGQSIHGDNTTNIGLQFFFFFGIPSLCASCSQISVDDDKIVVQRWDTT